MEPTYKNTIQPNDSLATALSLLERLSLVVPDELLAHDGFSLVTWAARIAHQEINRQTKPENFTDPKVLSLMLGEDRQLKMIPVDPETLIAVFRSVVSILIEFNSENR